MTRMHPEVPAKAGNVIGFNGKSVLYLVICDTPIAGCDELDQCADALVP